MFEFPTHKQLAENFERRKRNGDAARMLADESDDVKEGGFYTVSKSFSSGDESWTEDFWEVLSVCGPKAYVKIHPRHGEPILRFWDIAGRAWYSADDAWAIKLADADG